MLAAGLLDPRRRVHRVTEKDDLVFGRADLARHDWAEVQTGSKARRQTKVTLVAVARIFQGPHHIEVASDARRAADPRAQAPCDNDLVTDVTVNFAFVAHDGRRDVDDEAAQKPMEPQISQLLGNLG